MGTCLDTNSGHVQFDNKLRLGTTSTGPDDNASEHDENQNENTNNGNESGVNSASDENTDYNDKNNDNDNNAMANSDTTTTTNKIQHVANMLDLANETIMETEELQDIELDKDDDNNEENKDDEEDEEEYEHDKFNKMMTEYIVTDDMQENIDSLIDKKVKELSSSTTYIFSQSAVATKCGQKEGKDKTNQDSYFVFDEFGPSSILQFFGVCDGHGPSGHNVSQYCSKYLPQILLSDKENTLITLEKPGYALIRAFEELEKKLLSDKENGNITFDISASGTTISCGLRVGDYLYLANLGDSRAVIGNFDGDMSEDPDGDGGSANTLNINNGKKIRASSRQLTVDHDPKNKTEADRIGQSRDGKLLVDDDGTSRIQIKLIDDKLGKPRQSVLQLKQTYGVDALKQLAAVSASVSRSIGDKLAHKYGGVISKPDVIIHKLCREDLFVMWASDGIWAVIDNDDVTRIIGNKLKTVYNQKKYDDFDKITKKLVREAHIVWTDEFDDYVDDITAVIARLGKNNK